MRLATGVHAIAAKATDLAGNVSAASGVLSVTIDTAAPVAPSVPDLVVASDSGASSTDNTTNVTKPTFTGTAEANATVTLFDGATSVGTGQADASRLWSVTTSALADWRPCDQREGDRSRRQCQRGLGGAVGHDRHRSTSRRRALPR